MTATIERLAGQDFDFLFHFRQALLGGPIDQNDSSFTLQFDEFGDGSSIVTLVVSGLDFAYDADHPIQGVITDFQLSLATNDFGHVDIAVGSGFAIDTAQLDFQQALSQASSFGDSEQLYRLFATGPLDQTGTSTNDNFELYGSGNTIDGGGGHDDLDLSLGY